MICDLAGSAGRARDLRGLRRDGIRPDVGAGHSAGRAIPFDPTGAVLCGGEPGDSPGVKATCAERPNPTTTVLQTARKRQTVNVRGKVAGRRQTVNNSDARPAATGPGV